MAHVLRIRSVAQPHAVGPEGPPGVANRCGRLAIACGAVVRAEPAAGLPRRLLASLWVMAAAAAIFLGRPDEGDLLTARSP